MKKLRWWRKLFITITIILYTHSYVPLVALSFFKPFIAITNSLMPLMKRDEEAEMIQRLSKLSRYFSYLRTLITIFLSHSSSFTHYKAMSSSWKPLMRIWSNVSSRLTLYLLCLSTLICVFLSHSLLQTLQSHREFLEPTDEDRIKRFIVTISLPIYYV